jgi:hypothetical protein
MENHEVSRRTLLKGGGAALAGMTVLRVAGPAQAFPGQPGVSVRHEASDERGAGTARTSLGGLTPCQQPLWAEQLERRLLRVFRNYANLLLSPIITR